MRFVALAAILVAAAPPGSPSLVDTLLRKSWEASGVTPAAAVDDAGFLRRASLDLTGTIPSADEAAAFLADARPDKRSLKIDELLARPEYAHHWAEHWEKVLVGYDAQARQTSKRGLYYWLRDEVFAKNMPFDQVARALLTAKGISTESGPVNFLLAHSRKGGGAIAIASKVSRTLLGVQIQCAQCHDHPFDRYTQEDFHGMVAFFARTANRKVDGKDQKDPRYELYEKPTGEASYGEGKAKKTVPPQFLDGTPAEKSRDRREEFARLMLRPGPQFARATVNRVWSHFFGRGIVNPIDDFSGRTKPSQPELLESLAKEFEAGGYDVRRLLKAVAGSEAYQRASRRPAEPVSEKHFSYALTRPLSPEQIYNSLLKALGADAVPPTRSPKDEGQKSAQAQDNVLGQFRRMFADAESLDMPEFEGTIPQALMLMNGSAVNQALVSKSGRVAKILQERAEPADRVERIFLTVLSRKPTGRELETHLAYVKAATNAAPYEDVLWVLLNSSEFLFNH